MIKKEYLFSLMGLVWIVGSVNAQPILDNQADIGNKLLVKEGIFLTYEDFLHNQPIKVTSIITKLDTSSIDFYFELFKNKEIEYLKEDSLKQIEGKTIFGYYDGWGIYVNLTNIPSGWRYKYTSDYSFTRVNIFGELSVVHFALQKTNKFNNNIGGMALNPDAVDGRESKIYCLILDFRDGKAYEMNKMNLEFLLSGDVELQKEYKRSKEDEDIKPFIFIGKYNKRHPFEFK